MTLDVLDFIAEKGGNPDAIRESQGKRGHSVELVDEVIALYAKWVKSKLSVHETISLLSFLIHFIRCFVFYS